MLGGFSVLTISSFPVNDVCTCLFPFSTPTFCCSTWRGRFSCVSVDPDRRRPARAVREPRAVSGLRVSSGPCARAALLQLPFNPRASPTPGPQRPLRHVRRAGPARAWRPGDSQELTVTSLPALEAADFIPKCLKLAWREGAPPAGLLGLFRSQRTFERRRPAGSRRALP